MKTFEKYLKKQYFKYGISSLIVFLFLGFSYSKDLTNSSYQTQINENSIVNPEDTAEYSKYHKQERAIAFFKYYNEWSLGINPFTNNVKVGDKIPFILNFAPTFDKAYEIIVYVLGHKIKSVNDSILEKRVIQSDKFSIIYTSYPGTKDYEFIAETGFDKFEIQVKVNPILLDYNEIKKGWSYSSLIQCAESKEELTESVYIIDDYNHSFYQVPTLKIDEIKEIAQYLIIFQKKGMLKTVKVIGHSCPKAKSEASNLYASENRAKSVTDVLIKYKIDKNLITTHGEASKRPRLGYQEASPTSPERVLKPHRRVEIICILFN